MREASADVQDRLRAMAAVLTAVRGRLDAIASGLPEEEPGLEGEESGPGLRSLIGCVLTDSLLCRARHKMDYAEPRIMPTAPGFLS